MKCKISWIDDKGNTTPDDNEAIGVVWREAYTLVCPDAVNGTIQYTETERFPICAEHAKRLPIVHWNFEAF